MENFYRPPTGSRYIQWSMNGHNRLCPLRNQWPPIRMPLKLIYQRLQPNNSALSSGLSGCCVSKAQPTVSGITLCVWLPNASNSWLALLDRCYIGPWTPPPPPSLTHSLIHSQLIWRRPPCTSWPPPGRAQALFSASGPAAWHTNYITAMRVNFLLLHFFSVP